MTPLQYRRWYDFARRMALRGFPDATEERRKKIAKEVRRVLWCMEYDAPAIVDWDASPVYVGDRVSELLDGRHYHEKFLKSGEVEPRRNRFLAQVECCIRAGLDVASEPSAGVVGFTVGDIRRMYPLGIPAWIAEFFTVPGPLSDAMPDDAGVWL